MRLLAKRVDDKSGEKSPWGFWRWFDIHQNGEIYLTRLTLLRTPWFAIKLHWIKKPDPDRDLHDHPWRFWSFVIRGGYKEIVNKFPWLVGQEVERTVNWFNYKDSVTSHRISEVKPGTITLVVTGLKHKRWGFYDKDTGQFVHWRDYHAAQS